MNLAIIGCNSMGALHARMAANAGFRVAVCADLNLKAARKLAKEFGAKAFADGVEAIRHPLIDAVCIATPTPSHKPLVIAAAKAGKAIFCEKPFCRTEKDCAEALKAVDKAGVKLFVGHVVRYFHEFETLRTQMASGRIGKPGFVKMYRGGICPAGAGNWFSDFKQSGGVTFDCSIHDFDWLRYVFGDVERVFSQNMPRLKPFPMDYSMTTLRMKNGLIGHVVGTWAQPAGFRVKVEVCGTEGMIQYDSAEAPMSTAPRSVQAGPSMIVPASPVAVSPYQLEWEDFGGWLAEKHAPRVTPEDGLIAVRIAAAALDSARTGQPVTL